MDVATLAYGFASAGPRVASVLFGATTPEQVRRNVRRLDDEQLAATPARCRRVTPV